MELIIANKTIVELYKKGNITILRQICEACIIQKDNLENQKEIILTNVGNKHPMPNNSKEAREASVI